MPFPPPPQPPPPDPLEVELLGEMVYCWGCHEWWPADKEFFLFNKKTGRFHSPCYACRTEARREIGTRPCIVPGCTEPRATWRVSRCLKHRQEQVEAQRRKRRESHETDHLTRAAG